MSEDEIKADRYAKFRALGDYRDFVVKGGQYAKADEERKNAEGVRSKSGRWAQVRLPAILFFGMNIEQYWDS